jgi:hypothetical protein
MAARGVRQTGCATLVADVPTAVSIWLVFEGSGRGDFALGEAVAMLARRVHVTGRQWILTD